MADEAFKELAKNIPVDMKRMFSGGCKVLRGLRAWRDAVAVRLAVRGRKARIASRQRGHVRVAELPSYCLRSLGSR